MKFKILTILLVFVALGHLQAQTITGKITGLSEGEKVWLYTNPEERIEHKWALSHVVDSCTVKDKSFTFRVPPAEHSRLWLLRTDQKLLKYFFNKDENFYIEGTSSISILLNEKEQGGREHILFQDIFSILDQANVTPIERQAATEWLKRHAGQDVASFATAYFYMVKKELRTKDVSEIISNIPENQRKNPFFQQLFDFYQKESAMQPGNTLPILKLFSADGREVSTAQLKNKPLLIYSFTQRNNSSLFLRKLKQLLAIQQSIPDLQFVIIYPAFSKDITKQVEIETAGKTVIQADYTKTSQANPAFFYDRYRSYSIILADKSSVIQGFNPMPEDCVEILNSPLIENGFVINGYVSGLTEGIAELVTSKEGTLTTPDIIDTAIIQNGYFTFKGKLATPKFCNVNIRNTSFPVGFYLENSPIDVNIRLRFGESVENGVRTSQISLTGKAYGSRSEQEYQYLLNIQQPDLIEEWITTHPGNIPALFCLATTWINKFPPEVIEKWLSKINKNLVDNIAYKETLQQIAKRKQLSSGKKAPDFTLPTNTEKNISLKDFAGKYVLIDFWASWCGPCKSEIPNLKKAWDKYHKKGLEIISITIDQKEQDWLKALKDEKMPWIQLNGHGSKIPEMYNVQGIPHILLIGPDQKIIAINLRGEKLENKLAELFK